VTSYWKFILGIPQIISALLLSFFLDHQKYNSYLFENRLSINLHFHAQSRDVYRIPRFKFAPSANKRNGHGDIASDREFAREFVRNFAAKNSLSVYDIGSKGKTGLHGHHSTLDLAFNIHRQDIPENALFSLIDVHSHLHERTFTSIASHMRPMILYCADPVGNFTTSSLRTCFEIHDGVLHVRQYITQGERYLDPVYNFGSASHATFEGRHLSYHYRQASYRVNNHHILVILTPMAITSHGYPLKDVETIRPIKITAYPFARIYLALELVSIHTSDVYSWTITTKQFDAIIGAGESIDTIARKLAVDKSFDPELFAHLRSFKNFHEQLTITVHSSCDAQEWIKPWPRHKRQLFTLEDLTDYPPHDMPHTDVPLEYATFRHHPNAGQQKLLFIENLFLENIPKASGKYKPRVLYLGSAPGKHIRNLVRFKEIDWYLVDPREHIPELYQFDNVHIATKMPDVMPWTVFDGFLSDIRSSTTDEGVAADNVLQFQIWERVNRPYAMFKFRTPRCEGNTSAPNGIFMLNPCRPWKSTESRLLVNRNSKMISIPNLQYSTFAYDFIQTADWNFKAHAFWKMDYTVTSGSYEVTAAHIAPTWYHMQERNNCTIFGTVDQVVFFPTKNPSQSINAHMRRYFAQARPLWPQLTPVERADEFLAFNAIALKFASHFKRFSRLGELDKMSELTSKQRNQIEDVLRLTEEDKSVNRVNIFSKAETYGEVKDNRLISNVPPFVNHLLDRVATLMQEQMCTDPHFTWYAPGRRVQKALLYGEPIHDGLRYLTEAPLKEYDSRLTTFLTYCNSGRYMVKSTDISRNDGSNTFLFIILFYHVLHEINPAAAELWWWSSSMPFYLIDGDRTDVTRKYRVASMYQQFSGSQYTLLFNCTKHAFIQYYTAVRVIGEQYKLQDKAGKSLCKIPKDAAQIDSWAWASISTTLGDDVNPFSWLYEDYIRWAAHLGFKATDEAPHALGYTHFAGKLWTPDSKWTFDPSRVIPKILACSGNYTPEQNLLNKWAGYRLERATDTRIPILTKLAEYAATRGGRILREYQSAADRATHMPQQMINEIWDHDYPAAKFVDAQLNDDMSIQDIVDLLTTSFPVSEALAFSGGTILTQGDYITAPSEKLYVDPSHAFVQLESFADIVSQTVGVKLNTDVYDTTRYIKDHGHEHAITWNYGKQRDPSEAQKMDEACARLEALLNHESPKDPVDHGPGTGRDLDDESIAFTGETSPYKTLLCSTFEEFNASINKATSISVEVSELLTVKNPYFDGKTFGKKPTKPKPIQKHKKKTNVKVTKPTPSSSKSGNRRRNPAKRPGKSLVKNPRKQ
jgi:hypothetical protein